MPDQVPRSAGSGEEAISAATHRRRGWSCFVPCIFKPCAEGSSFVEYAEGVHLRSSQATSRRSSGSSGGPRVKSVPMTPGGRQLVRDAASVHPSPQRRVCVAAACPLDDTVKRASCVRTVVTDACPPHAALILPLGAELVGPRSERLLPRHSPSIRGSPWALSSPTSAP